MTTDTRIVYSARCSWWGTISEVGKLPGSGLPCCPHCQSVLFETESEATWWAGVDARNETDPGYRQFIEWLRDKHFPTFAEARTEWEKGR